MTKTNKVNPNILKTGLGMLLILLFMGLVFNFSIDLVGTHGEKESANIFLWPIKQFSELLVYKGIGIDDHGASVLAFFITELPFVYLLVVFFSYVFNFARSFSTDKEIAEGMESKSGFGGRLVGSLAGFVSPFCSCSTIPIMNTFAKARAPFGTVISFLITSPMINESGIALMGSFFGYKVALIYIAFGFVIGIFGSYVATGLKLDDQFKVQPDPDYERKALLKRRITFKYLHKRAGKESKANFKSVGGIMIIAMAIGSMMHGGIPDEGIKNNIGNQGGAPLVLVPIGAMLYLNISATLPITNSFVQSGLGLGPALSFTMGVNTLSLPELIMLTKIFKRKFMLFFVIYLLLAILAFAYILMVIPDGVLM